MAINKKLIHFQTLSNFNTQLSAGNILDTSIVFIKDAKKIWTHGQFYDCAGGEMDNDELSEFVGRLIGYGEGEDGVFSDGYYYDGGGDSVVATIEAMDTNIHNALMGKANASTTLDGYGITDKLFKSLGTQANIADTKGWGVFQYNSTTAGAPSNYGSIIQWVNPTNYDSKPSVNGWYTQLFSSTDNGGLSYRTATNGYGWKKWVNLVDSNNIGSHLKTINGQSIVGSGDITISGGGDYLPSTGGIINGYLAVMGTISSPTLIIANGGVQGCLRNSDSDYILGLGGGGDIVWGKEAENEYYITAKGDGTKFLSDDGTYKTISSGGGVYITPFSVEQFCTGNVILTDEQRNGLLNAASQNRIIGMPYSSSFYNSVGYIVADYQYEYEDDFWQLTLDVIYNGSSYRNFIRSKGYTDFLLSRLIATVFKPIEHLVTAEDGVATVSDVLANTDNCTYLVDGECTELYIYLEPSNIGKTVRFFTSESCMLEIGSPVYWANGEVPTIEPYTHYELSLVANMDGAFNTVLTPFKAVE